jgi:outer membrane protein
MKHGSLLNRAHRLLLLIVSALLAVGRFSGLAETNSPAEPITRLISLNQCISTALLQNRLLQIERLNPPIAQAWLSASYGYYDPLFLTDLRRESATDSGGFDPSDFSRDAVYSADSDAARSSLTGFLPGGFSYTFSGAYAHSEGFRNGFNFDSHSIVGSVFARQPLLRNFWIDQGRMTIQVNKKNLKITELGVRYVAMDVITRVQRSYYELAYAQGEKRIRQDLLETRRQLLASVRRKIELGTLTILDEKLAEAQVANVEADLGVTMNSTALAENELKFWLGDPWTNSFNIRLTPEPLVVLPDQFDLQASWRQGLAHRPDLAQFRHDVEKADIDLKYRRNQLFPGLDLIASYGRKGASTVQVFPPFPASASSSDAFDQWADGDAPSDMVGVIFSLPLGRAAERGSYRASKYLRTQAELRVKQYEEQVLREISDAIHTVRSSLERVTRTARARTLAAEALSAEEQKLAGGKSTLFFVLQLQNDLASARFAELRAKADYNQAVAQLGFVEASTLDRHRLSLDLN